MVPGECHPDLDGAKLGIAHVRDRDAANDFQYLYFTVADQRAWPCYRLVRWDFGAANQSCTAPEAERAFRVVYDSCADASAGGTMAAGGLAYRPPLDEPGPPEGGELYVAVKTASNPLSVGNRILRFQLAPDEDGCPAGACVPVPIAGGATAGFDGDGPATERLLRLPVDLGVGTLAVPGDGRDLLLIADTGNHRIRAVNLKAPGNPAIVVAGVTVPAGELVTIAGNRDCGGALGGGCLDDAIDCHCQADQNGSVTCAPVDVIGGGDAEGEAADTDLRAPVSVAAGPGELYVSERCRHTILVIDASPGGGGLRRLAGTTDAPGTAGLGPYLGWWPECDSGRPAFAPARSAELGFPGDLWVGWYGTHLYVGRGSGITLIRAHDRDDDLVPDCDDNCPELANPLQEDADGDDLGDACDPDADADGVANVADNCPGVANDDDLDNDGLTNDREARYGTEPQDSDSDNDGFPDGCEVDACIAPDGTVLSSGTDPIVFDSDPFPFGGTPDELDDRVRSRVNVWSVEAALTFSGDFEDDPDDSCICTRKTHGGTLTGGWGMWDPLVAEPFELLPPVGYDPTPAVSPIMPAIGLFRSRASTEAMLTLSGDSFECQSFGRVNGQCQEVPCGIEVTDRVNFDDVQFSALRDFEAGGYLMTFGLRECACATAVERDGGASACWEAEAELSTSQLHHPRLPRARDETNDRTLPVVGKIPFGKLMGTEPFSIEVLATYELELDEPVPTKKHKKLTGELRFKPIYIESPEDVDGGRHRVPGDAAAGVPGSQFTFNSASPGVLGVLVRATQPDEAAAATYLNDNLCWTVGDPIGSASFTVQSWSDTAEPCTGAIGTGDGGMGREETTSFTGLPEQLADFGKKLVRAELRQPDGTWITLGYSRMEVFYTKEATNNPDPSRPPNWFYYRMQQRGPPYPMTPNCEGPLFTYNAPACSGAIGAMIFTTPPGVPVGPLPTNLTLCPGAAPLTNHGVQAVIRHEWAHRDHMCRTVWRGGDWSSMEDSDGDLLRDLWEDPTPFDDQNGDRICNPRAPDPECWVAYSHAFFVNGEHDSYCLDGDRALEDCRADWANPGCQAGAGDGTACPLTPVD